MYRHQEKKFGVLSPALGFTFLSKILQHSEDNYYFIGLSPCLTHLDFEKLSILRLLISNVKPSTPETVFNSTMTSLLGISWQKNCQLE